jgi:hypothetical protein
LRSPDASARGLRALPLLELAALVTAALLALLFHIRLPGRLPDEAAYRQVAAHLLAHARPGDAVVLHPWWTDRARLYLPPALPLWSDVHNAERDYVESPRLWLLAQPELPRADAAGFMQRFLPGRTPEGAPVRFGTLELTAYHNGRHRPAAFRATQSAASARVYLEDLRTGARTACPWDGRAHRCPGPSHLYVAPEWREIDFAPAHCLWMHAPGGPVRLVAEFADVPAAALLRLEGGIVGEHAAQRSGRLTPAHLGVEDASTGDSLLRLSLPPGTEGLQRADRAGLPGEGPRTLRVWTQSDLADLRWVCLDVAALGPPVQEGP